MLHIARDEDWRHAQASGVYSLPGGVVYGCSDAQLAMVVEAHFPKHEGWLVLSVDESQASGEVRWVTFRRGDRSETFPHLHGSFPASAVSSVRTLVEALTDS